MRELLVLPRGDNRARGAFECPRDGSAAVDARAVEVLQRVRGGRLWCHGCLGELGNRWLWWGLRAVRDGSGIGGGTRVTCVVLFTMVGGVGLTSEEGYRCVATTTVWYVWALGIIDPCLSSLGRKHHDPSLATSLVVV